MLESAADLDERPFVQTTIARQLGSRLALTHDERGISVFAGPWGIGKTTAIDAFAADYWPAVAIVKVDPGNSKRGATPSSIMMLAIEAVRRIVEGRERALTPNSFWALKSNLFAMFEKWSHEHWGKERHWDRRFTFIFDEAQYLSRDAIEMLRYWNDDDRTTAPFPIGIVFVGNNEFALQDDGTGQSVLSGAVRSRALFIEQLDYADVSDPDLVLFAQSRGLTDPGAIGVFTAYFSSPRVRRDLRNAERLLKVIKRRAGDDPVTAAVVREVLSP